MINGPLTNGCMQGRIGILFGSGASLDSVSVDALRVFKSQSFLTVAANLTVESAKMINASFFPDVLTQFDGMPDDDIFEKGFNLISSVQRRVGGNTWRVAVKHKQFPAWPFADQLYKRSDVELYGSGGGFAAGMMYRWGIRKIYCIGIDHCGPYCKWGGLLSGGMECPWAVNDGLRDVATGAWLQLQDAFRDLSIYNCNGDALPVTRGNVRFRTVNHAVQEVA